jgi:hypothetical protein
MDWLSALPVLGDFPAATSWAQSVTALDNAADATRIRTAAVD